MQNMKTNAVAKFKGLVNSSKNPKAIINTLQLRSDLPTLKERETEAYVNIAVMVAETAIQFQNSSRGVLTKQSTLASLYDVLTAHPFITVELIAFMLVVMNVTLKASGSPFERFNQAITTSDAMLAYAYYWILVNFFYKGHRSKYFTLPGCTSTEESRELFDLKHQAAELQLMVVAKVVTDSGRALPIFDNYYFKRSSSGFGVDDEDQDTSDPDDRNYSASSNRSGVARQSTESHGDEGDDQADGGDESEEHED
jgi:hypothetical protein